MRSPKDDLTGCHVAADRQSQASAVLAMARAWLLVAMHSICCLPFWINN